jgi:hypothetical protein
MATTTRGSEGVGYVLKTCANKHLVTNWRENGTSGEPGLLRRFGRVPRLFNRKKKSKKRFALVF